jgi:2-iminobutanoate/2-iminopropanoate deaminase
MNVFSVFFNTFQLCISSETQLSFIQPSGYMNHKIISTNKAPQAIGPYSQAVVHNGMVYCSGQIALDPETMEIVKGGVAQQTEQVMKNLGALLAEAGSSFGKVVKCSIFLDTMDDFTVVNGIYGRYFESNPPARETVAVQTLPKNVLVEISCIAYI